MTLRTALASVAILLSVCACSGPAKEKKQEKVKAPVEAEPESDTFDSGLPAPQYVTDVKKMQILSITDTLYRGDTLKIKFKTPHYQDLGIRTPDDKFFFAVFSGLDSGKPSLVDYSAFAEIDQLEIITDKTKL